MDGADHELVRYVMRTQFRGGFRWNWGKTIYGRWQSYMIDNSRQTAEFTYDERGHSGDSHIFAPIMRKHYAYSETTPAAQYVALPEGTPTSELPDRDLSAEHNEWFKGGVFWARKKTTCGGTSFGMPCTFNSKHPDSFYEAEWNSCSYLGDTRPWCYTRTDRSAWGYCDCENDADDFTRLVGWLPAFHNKGPRMGGDVYMVTTAAAPPPFPAPRRHHNRWQPPPPCVVTPKPSGGGRPLPLADRTAARRKHLFRSSADVSSPSHFRCPTTSTGRSWACSTRRARKPRGCASRANCASPRSATCPS